MKAHPALTEEHEAFRDTMRRFVQREIKKELAARQLGRLKPLGWGICPISVGLISCLSAK